MIQIKCMVFDYGGGIGKKQNIEAVMTMCDILHVSPDKFYSFYTKERQNYDSGFIDAKAFWLKTSASAGHKITTEDIDTLIQLDIKSWLDINNETIAYVESIKDKVKLAILSNMTFDVLEIIKNLYWMNYFDEKIYSCEEKVSKPGDKIYGICSKRVNVDPPNMLFIDDSEINCIAAQKIGIHCIHFTSCETMENIIRNNYTFTPTLHIP